VVFAEQSNISVLDYGGDENESKEGKYEGDENESLGVLYGGEENESLD
jgi:hypothetical protein